MCLWTKTWYKMMQKKCIMGYVAGLLLLHHNTRALITRMTHLWRWKDPDIWRPSRFRWKEASGKRLGWAPVRSADFEETPTKSWWHSALQEVCWAATLFPEPTLITESPSETPQREQKRLFQRLEEILLFCPEVFQADWKQRKQEVMRYSERLRSIRDGDAKHKPLWHSWSQQTPSDCSCSCCQ